MSNNISEIKELIEVIQKSGLGKVKIKTDTFSIEVNKESYPKKTYTHHSVESTPTLPKEIVNVPHEAFLKVTVVPSLTPVGNGVTLTNTTTIKSPMIGTFYRRPSPDKPLLVEVGAKIKKGQVLCIIEAMKLFNEIQSEVDGTVVKVLIEDGSSVQYDQNLFLVE